MLIATFNEDGFIVISNQRGEEVEIPLSGELYEAIAAIASDDNNTDDE